MALLVRRGVLVTRSETRQWPPQRRQRLRQGVLASIVGSSPFMLVLLLCSLSFVLLYPILVVDQKTAIRDLMKVDANEHPHKRALDGFDDGVVWNGAEEVEKTSLRSSSGTKTIDDPFSRDPPFLISSINFVEPTKTHNATSTAVLLDDRKEYVLKRDIVEYPKLEHSEFALVEPASYANRVELTNKEYFINNSTVFHIAQYNPALFFAQIYPELKEKILDPRAIIPHKEELFARAANSTEHDVLLSGGWGAIRPGMRPKTISGEWLEKNWKGKIIFLNGEYFAKSGWSNSSVLPFKNQYHIGFVKDGCQSVRLHFLTQKYGASPHLWDSFRPEAAKPTSKQERFVIYINRNCVDFREEAFDSIAMEFPNKTLEYGSKCLGNKKNLTNVVRTDIRLQKWEGMWNDMNKDTFNHFRFCLVMENHDLEGYITEKIMNAFMGGCIP